MNASLKELFSELHDPPDQTDSKAAYLRHHLILWVGKDADIHETGTRSQVCRGNNKPPSACRAVAIHDTARIAHEIS